MVLPFTVHCTSLTGRTERMLDWHLCLLASEKMFSIVTGEELEWLNWDSGCIDAPTNAFVFFKTVFDIIVFSGNLLRTLFFWHPQNSTLDLLSPMEFHSHYLCHIFAIQMFHGGIRTKLKQNVEMKTLPQYDAPIEVVLRYQLYKVTAISPAGTAGFESSTEVARTPSRTLYSYCSSIDFVVVGFSFTSVLL